MPISAGCDLQPTQFALTVRFEQGYRFLDKCGEALVRLESTLDEDWIPTETTPTGGQLRNYTLGMLAKFNSDLMQVVQGEFLSFDHFVDQSGKIYDILRSTFNIDRILTPTLRVILQVGFTEEESAEDYLGNLRLFCPDKEFVDILDGIQIAQSFTLCCKKDMTWDDQSVTQRTRVEARQVRQERQPHFDERLLQRAALLAKRQHEAMKKLRKLRRQHSMVSERAIQFDVERSFHTEFSSGTFDLAKFLQESRKWSREVEEFLEKRKV